LETVKTEVGGSRSPAGPQLVRCHGLDVTVNLTVVASDWKEVVTWWYDDGEVEVRLFSAFL